PRADETLLTNFVQDAEIIEGPERKACDADPGAVGAPVRVRVRKLDLDAMPGKRQSRAHPADAAADNQGFTNHCAPSRPMLRPVPATGPCRESFRHAVRCR